MNGDVDGQLQFLFYDLLQEIRSLQDISETFIDRRSSWVLKQLAEDLESLLGADSSHARPWELHDLWTIPSEGDYECNKRRGSKRVVACISGKWDVQPLGNNSKKPRVRQKRHLAFVGIASTRVRLYYAEDLKSPIAMWRTELGDASSPGCFFHVQVLGEDVNPPFPKAIPVPRLPTLFVTPMGVIEYVLGELFQDPWAKMTMEQNSNVLRWANIQRGRLLRLLDWQRRIVDIAVSSPWVSMKIAKPSATLFT